MSDALELDERDAAIFSERFHAYQDIHGPRVGDFVRFADGHLERISHHWGDSVQTSESGSFYLGKGYCSFSGSLNPAIPLDELEYRADHKRGSVWFFHHDEWRAHNGVNASLDFRVYVVPGNRREFEFRGRTVRSDYEREMTSC